MIAVFAAMAGQLALSVKRAHDLGLSGRSIFQPLGSLRLAFADGDPHDNQYGPARDVAGEGFPIRRAGAWIAGLLLFALAASGAILYAEFRTWDCKPSVEAQGTSMEDARRQWLRAVEAAHGRAYAESGLSAMSNTTCRGSECRMSARPCVRAR